MGDMETNDPRKPGDDELERRLERYAELRLRPDPDAMDRIRASLVARAGEPAGPATRPAPRIARRWRTAVAALAAAAVLLVAVGAAAAASGPGGALYGARLWIESATLPTEPAARARAELLRLDRRLDEARAAAANGDAAAADAALGAYDDITAEAEAGVAGDTDRLTHLESELSKHLAVLDALLDQVPAQAQGAIQHAIERSSKALERLQSGGGTPGGGTPGGQGGNPHGSPQPGGPDGSPGNPHPSKGPDGSPGNPHPSKGPDALPREPARVAPAGRPGRLARQAQPEAEQDPEDLIRGGCRCRVKTRPDSGTVIRDPSRRCPCARLAAMPPTTMPSAPVRWI